MNAPLKGDPAAEAEAEVVEGTDADGELNDALIYGPEPEGLHAFLLKPATFLTGELWGAKDRRNTQLWKPLTMSWGEWINGGAGNKNQKAWGLSRHPVGKHKEGASIVLGSSIEGARKANAMDEMFALGLDIDSGARLDDVIETILNKNLFALIYTSFNHGKSGLEIKRDEVMRKLQITEEPTLAQVQEYLRVHSKSRYEETFIAAVRIEEAKRQTKEGVKIVLSTPPLDKFRIIFPLAEPVKLIDLAPTQKECLGVWEDKITGMAWETLGVHFDVSCTDPSRLFYTARHAEDAEWDCLILRGNPLRFEDIPTMKKSDYTRSRGGVAGAGREVDQWGNPLCETPSGKSLNDWHRNAKDRFQLATLLEDMVPDKIRHAGGEAAGHVHVECPFEAEHSSEGGTATMAVDALDAKSGFWTIFCQHDSCDGRHKLEFLEEALSQGWFDEEVLFDEDGHYLLEPGEEVVSESQSDSQVPASAGVSFCSDVLAPLYDELLVDGEGFLRGPAEHKVLYAKYDIKPGVSDEEQQRAYKAMVQVVRGQIREAMRARFSYVVTGDKARAGVRSAPGRAVSWYDEGALDRLFRNREVSYFVENGKGEPKVEKLKPAQLFMYDRNRSTYSKTDFEPDPEQAERVEAEGAFNLWTDFAAEPVEGDWLLLRNHVKNVICGGDVALFNWHMTFIASIFARPGVKVPSSIAVKGEQGTGKSKLWDWVREGLGCTAMKVSQGKHLVGQFNGHLDGKVLLVCEEAFWAGDKAAAGVIKDLISAEELTIEAKHQNAETRKNRFCVVFVSNNDWIIPTDGTDARRFAVLEATNDHKKDAPYFAAIDQQMKNGGLEAMVYELTHWNPEAVNLTWDSLRTPPETEGLRQQAGMGLNGPLAALVAVLEAGKLDDRTKSGEAFYYDLSDTEPTRVERAHLNAVLGIKNGRGNETVEGIKAIETLFGADAIHGNKALVTYQGAMERDENGNRQRPIITTEERVRFVDIPPLDDLKHVLAGYGRG